jgi:hypothetical protein
VATDYAIAVLTDGSYPPAGTQIVGLEVVIEPDSATKVEALLTESRVDTDIKITLKQWTAGETTVAATSVLIDGWQGCWTFAHECLEARCWTRSRLRR